jgi:anti-sigma factor ChrR (cupin superfamily)
MQVHGLSVSEPEEDYRRRKARSTCDKIPLPSLRARLDRKGGKTLMYNVKCHAESLEWIPLDFPGVFMRVLHTEDTGAMSVLTRMSPGAIIPAHLHTQARETVYVLEGEFVEDGEIHGPGSFFAAKPGVPHGPHGSISGCLVLTAFSATLDFVLV